ncbi:MAG: hypothetical protein MK312_12805, partial [Roseibacillus sp.]|nr:hypothetical protein [Roseibacillus sp.]
LLLSIPGMPRSLRRVSAEHARDFSQKRLAPHKFPILILSVKIAQRELDRLTVSIAPVVLLC